MLKGFRDFVLRGNVVDLAVAVVIGTAFHNIVTSLVSNIINPLIAAIFGKPDFAAFVVYVNHGKIQIGDFLNSVISFVLVAAAVYFFIVLPINSFLNRMKKPEPAAPQTTRPCPECLSDIPLAATRCAHCAQPVPAASSAS